MAGWAGCCSPGVLIWTEDTEADHIRLCMAGDWADPADTTHFLAVCWRDASRIYRLTDSPEAGQRLYLLAVPPSCTAVCDWLAGVPALGGVSCTEQMGRSPMV